eukprot:5239943-Amphidinium_carterae.1
MLKRIMRVSAVRMSNFKLVALRDDAEACEPYILPNKVQDDMAVWEHEEGTGFEGGLLHESMHPTAAEQRAAEEEEEARAAKVATLEARRARMQARRE